MLPSTLAFTLYCICHHILLSLISFEEKRKNKYMFLKTANYIMCAEEYLELIYVFNCVTLFWADKKDTDCKLGRCHSWIGLSGTNNKKVVSACAAIILINQWQASSFWDTIKCRPMLECWLDNIITLDLLWYDTLSDEMMICQNNRNKVIINKY